MVQGLVHRKTSACDQDEDAVATFEARCSAAGRRDPSHGEDNPEILNSAGMGRGWLVELKTQPSQSPDLNVNDLGFFASLKSRVWRANASSVDELVQNVFDDQYEEYDADTLERVWQSLFKVYKHFASWVITTSVWSIPGWGNGRGTGRWKRW